MSNQVSAVEELQQMEAQINTDAINSMLNQSGTTERNGNAQDYNGPVMDFQKNLIVRRNFLRVEMC